MSSDLQSDRGLRYNVSHAGANRGSIVIGAGLADARLRTLNLSGSTIVPW